LVTPVTVNVKVAPLVFEEGDLKETVPEVLVVPVTVPDTAPDHVPVTVALGKAPLAVTTVTNALAFADLLFPDRVALIVRDDTRADRVPTMDRGELVVLAPLSSVVLTVTENVLGTVPV
jgi:hypothetical protein